MPPPPEQFSVPFLFTLSPFPLFELNEKEEYFDPGRVKGGRVERVRGKRLSVVGRDSSRETGP